MIRNFCEHFKGPLDHCGLDIHKVLPEWKNFKLFVKNNYVGYEALSLWKKIIQYRKEEFPNICMMAELMLSISGSNSSVERCFSILTIILTDRRLSMNHELMENVMLIAGNKNNWSDMEKNKIIDRAVEIYLSIRRTRKVGKESTSAGEPSAKVVILDESSCDSSDDEL